MVSTIEAAEILKEAKVAEGRKLGASFYRPVKDTTTGNLMMEHVATVGVPAANTGWGVSGTSAVATYGIGALGTIALFSAATDFEKAQNGGAAANATQRNRGLFKFAGAVACFALLAPGNYRYPFTGTRAEEAPRLGSFYRIYDEAETRSGPVF